MKSVIARFKCGWFCLINLVKGYRTEVWYRGFHGPVVKIAAIDGNDKIVKVFFERPDYTKEEREYINRVRESLM